MTKLFNYGYFHLNSGIYSEWRIDLDVLTDDDIETLALLIDRCVEPFSSVEGIPQGGIRLAKALEEWCDSDAQYHLIVDDVMTTGKSMDNARKNYSATHSKPVMGAVVFSRADPEMIPEWIEALFQVNPLASD